MAKRELFTITELVEYMDGKLTKDTAGRLTREGKIPYIKFPGIRRYFYDREAIDNWLSELQSNSVVVPDNKNALRMVR
ncbi:helix-turn-helix domain-containing protein [Acetivibrio cellulolyticus]|uniref:helix-turn-helix domain-containing protein n=1 Tax=Acetivibrio cellulolyticus TaxID=35830 RepID=UPI0001E2D96D|nr:helix-turn-helix domain-containing protein [Acetivibrio cellulolyticus]